MLEGDWCLFVYPLNILLKIIYISVCDIAIMNLLYIEMRKYSRKVYHAKRRGHYMYNLLYIEMRKYSRKVYHAKRRGHYMYNICTENDKSF